MRSNFHIHNVESRLRFQPNLQHKTRLIPHSMNYFNKQTQRTIQIYTTHQPFEALKESTYPNNVHINTNNSTTPLEPISVKFHPNFLSQEEQQTLLHDVERKIARRIYNKYHWDHAIHDYREITMKSTFWSEDSKLILQKIKKEIVGATRVAESEDDDPQTSPPQTSTPHGGHHDPSIVKFLPVHVLDISAEGYLKPHIDSELFSGGFVATISLLSSSVLTLQPQDPFQSLPVRNFIMMSLLLNY